MKFSFGKRNEGADGTGKGGRAKLTFKTPKREFGILMVSSFLSFLFLFLFLVFFFFWHKKFCPQALSFVHLFILLLVKWKGRDLIFCLQLCHDACQNNGFYWTMY